MGLALTMPTDKRTLLLDVMQKGVTKLLDEAKVPQRQHLEVIAALAQRVNDHKRDMQAHQEYMHRHESVLQNHERQIQDWDRTSKQLLSITHLKGEKGDSIKGEAGKDAEPVDVNVLVEHILSLIPKPEDGENGKDAVIDEDRVVGKLIRKLQTDKPLDISHIRNAQTFMKDGIKYKVEELMRGAGGGSGNSSGYQAPTTGAVNGTNRTFVWVAAPNVIVLDNGNAMNKVSSDGTVNWTGTTTTVLSQAPNFNIYATA